MGQVPSGQDNPLNTTYPVPVRNVQDIKSCPEVNLTPGIYSLVLGTAVKVKLRFFCNLKTTFAFFRDFLAVNINYLSKNHFESSNFLTKKMFCGKSVTQGKNNGEIYKELFQHVPNLIKNLIIQSICF